MITEEEDGNEDIIDTDQQCWDEISEEEFDDFTIHPTDALIACTTAQDDLSNIEIYIYDEISQSLYVHHDIMLSAFPLCIEWLPIMSSKKANYAIVSSFSPEIEIWNLDIQDALEPETTLGEPAESKDKYYKNLKKKKNQNKEESKYVHTGSVMALNVNPFNCGIVASGGEDKKFSFGI